MNSSTTAEFRSRFHALPSAMQDTARAAFRLWQQDHRHPSLHFKRVGAYWSIRVGIHYRALGRQQGGTLYWFWIGPHTEYDRLARF